MIYGLGPLWLSYGDLDLATSTLTTLTWNYEELSPYSPDPGLGPASLQNDGVITINLKPLYIYMYIIYIYTLYVIYILYLHKTLRQNFCGFLDAMCGTIAKLPLNPL